MRKALSLTAAAGLLALSSISATHAATTTGGATSIALTGGALSIGNGTPNNFNTVALNGFNQSTSTSFSNTLDVTDARGGSNGWSVTAQATQFSTGGASPNTLPTSSLAMATPSSVACPITSKCSASTASVSTFNPAGGTLDGGSAVTILSTGSGNSARGIYQFTLGGLTLSIPGDAYAGTYSSTLTFTVATL